MENFNEYRDQEAEKLKKIREIDRGAAQAHLEKLKTTDDYQQAETIHRAANNEKGGVQERTIEDKKEVPKYELQNPDWEETKKWENDVIKELREILGEEGEWPFNIEYDENGELSKVLVNAVSEGHGKLGEILKEQAIKDWQEHKEKERKLGNGATLMREDKYLIDAYKTDPEVKKILDAGIAKVQELRKVRGEFRKKIVDRKVDEYKTSEGLNEFLERLGIKEKAPDFNLDELIEQAENCPDEEVPALATSYGRLWSQILGLFDGYEFSKDQENDLRPDELALWEIGSRLRRAISSRAYKNHDGQYKSMEESMAITKSFSDEVAKSSTGRKYEYSPEINHSVFR